ncbi:MAG: hypothetical protein WCE44_04685 [Candidatus Velthaea sp.]
MNEAELTGRVAQLERRARRDRTFALGALAILLATAQAPSASSVSQPLNVTDATGAGARLDGSGLVVRDAKGVVRVAVRIDSAGSPSADLYDAAGNLRESAALLSDYPALRQFDTAGKLRSELFLGSGSNNGEYAIRDASGTTRLAVFQGSSGPPELALYGSDAKVRGYLATDDLMPYLVMNDNAGTTRVTIGGYTSGKVGADVRNAAGSVLWTVP